MFTIILILASLILKLNSFLHLSITFFVGFSLDLLSFYLNKKEKKNRNKVKIQTYDPNDISSPIYTAVLFNDKG